MPSPRVALDSIGCETKSVAFDISIGNEPQHSVEPPPSFEAFYEANIEGLRLALRLVANEAAAAADATEHAVVAVAQRWKQLEHHPHPMGWAFARGVSAIESSVRESPSPHIDEATGGYVHGLGLTEALRELPVQQRAALVAAYFLGWPDELTAAGAEDPTSRVTSRRQLGLRFLERHGLEDLSAIEATLRSTFTERSVSASDVMAESTDVAVVRRRGRRRRLRNRLLVSAAVLALIGVGAGLVQVSSSLATSESRGPQLVAGPSTSPDWFGPVSDGSGGFIALNTSGAARFAWSSDGIEWFREAIWNSRAVDLRSEVTGFDRAAGRYIATIEAASAINAYVSPFVATSTDLDTWDVRALDLGEPPQVDGLRLSVEIVGLAATVDNMLVAVQIDQVADYRSFGIRPGDVCLELDEPERLVLYLCDGETIDIPRSSSQSGAIALTRYFLGEGGGEFVEVAVPEAIDPYSLVGSANSFAAVDELSGDVLWSRDGRTWQNRFTPARQNRFTLLTGSERSTSLIVLPDASRWSSVRFTGTSEPSAGSVPVDLDPAAVWIKPELASGPAGWALFVTTSRPWERTNSSRGWAVDTGDWVVTLQPGATRITALAADGSRTLDFAQAGPFVETDGAGDINLVEPETGEELVSLSQDQIEASRSGAEFASSGAAAQVFFSDDGVEWRSIWEASEDTWFGTLAVGDDEVILSGTTLTGGPITIPLSG